MNQFSRDNKEVSKFLFFFFIIFVEIVFTVQRLRLAALLWTNMNYGSYKPKKMPVTGTVKVLSLPLEITYLMSVDYLLPS